MARMPGEQRPVRLPAPWVPGGRGARLWAWGPFAAGGADSARARPCRASGRWLILAARRGQKNIDALLRSITPVRKARYGVSRAISRKYWPRKQERVRYRPSKASLMTR